MDNIAEGSGDGHVFYEQTRLFSELVFEKGKLWPGFDYFIQRSVIYWFTTYFYAVPYFLFGNVYDSIFVFNSFVLVLVSLLLFNSIYNKDYDLNFSILNFLVILFFFSYWSHNLNLERDIIILFQVLLLMQVLSQFSSTNWIKSILFILFLILAMLGSRPEYIIVYILFIFIFIFKNEFSLVKRLTIIPTFLVGLFIILFLGSFTPAGGVSSFSLFRIMNSIIEFPMRLFYFAVGAFPWTRSGIIDDIGHNYIHLILHIISTVFRIIILLGLLSILLSILLGRYNRKIHFFYKEYLYCGLVLLSTLQFSSIGYTRYLDPALVLFIPPALIQIQGKITYYFFGSITILAFAHFFYYF